MSLHMWGKSTGSTWKRTDVAGQSIDMFEKMPVSKAIWKNALPAMAAMLMTLVYNLADTFFIGQTHDPLQVAAVSLGTPVFLMFMSVGSVFGIGGTSLISRSLGEGKKEYAKKINSYCAWMSLACGIVMAVCFLVFMNPLLKMIGASADTWGYAKTYLIICTLGGPAALLSSCFSNTIRSEGRATMAMIGQVIGNLTNMVLDAVFIMGFGWGITGCALATLSGECVGCLWYLMYYIGKKSVLSISLKNFSSGNGIASGVLSIGIPAALASILMSVSQILINARMSAYGDMAVAGIGVAMKVVIITGMVCMGFGQGVQPLLGYAAGAKNWERFRTLMKYSVIFSLVIGGVLTVLCYVFGGQIVGMFLTEQSSADFALEFSRILLTTGGIFGVFYVLTNALQAVGAAKEALVINLSRQGIIYIPALFLLQETFGIDGLVWAQPVSDAVSFAAAIVLYVFTLKKMTGSAEKTGVKSTVSKGCIS